MKRRGIAFFRQRKLWRRFFTIVQNSLNNLLVPIFGIVHSALVIRLASPDLWGAFVAVMLVPQLGAHIASWGNKEYLLRAFSRHPDEVAKNWQKSLVTRFLLAIALSLLIVFFGYTLVQAILVIAWGWALMLAQSYEVLILYRREFLFATVVESGTAATLSIFVVVLGNSLTVDSLMSLFTMAALAKSAVYFWHFRDITHPFHLRLELGYFSLAAPFFLLGFSGLLASRIDLYSVSYFLSEDEVGKYQVFINLMIYLQSISAYVVTPYAKGIYRLGDSAILKISLRLFVLGVLLLLPALSAAYFLLRFVYHIHYSMDYWLFGGVFVLPIYAYLPLIYRFYKLNQTGIVLKASLLGAGVNLLLNIILLPRMGASGAMFASALVQWGLLVVYLIEVRHIYTPAVSEVSSSA